MKTRNWGKTILAVLLAVMMILPSLAVSAEEGSVEVQYKLEEGKVYVYNPETGEWVPDETLTDSLDDFPEWPMLDVTAIGVGDQSEEVSGSVKATVTSDSADYGINATGAAVSASGEQPADLKVGQDIEVSATAESDSGYTAHVNTIGVMAYSSGEEAALNISVGGDVKATAESDSSASAYAVQVNTDGGKIGVEVAGEVSAEAIAADGQADANGVLVFEMNDFSEESTAGSTEEITAGSVKATATVEGGENGYANARAVVADAADGQTINVTVDGPVEATATNNAEDALFTEATAVEAKASGEDSQVAVTVSGDISAAAKASGENSVPNAQAVRLEAKDGGTVSFTATNGDITAAAEEENAYVAGLTTNNMGGDIEAEVTGDVTASGGEGAVGVLVSSVQAEEKQTIDTEAEPVEINLDEVDNEGSEDIDGDGEYDLIVCVGATKYIQTEDGRFLPVLQESNYEKGNTDLTITGDVKGDIGVELNVNEVQTANITVDGTVEGETAGILLRENTKLSDDITMTVWEVKPNKDGAVVVREEIKEDELAYTEDKEAEKLIQYIIKVEDTSKDYITTVGTKAFTAGNGNEYQVANEGDKVLMKLNIPEGKELVDAFWDVAKSQAGRLLKDAEGDYYLEVPRGGGVLLSVTLKDAPKPEPEPQPEPEPKPEPEMEPEPELEFYPVSELQPNPRQESKGTVQPAETKPYAYVLGPILKVRDMEGRVEIEFYRDKRFIVKLESGGQEKGTFRMEDGILILKCEDETEFHFDMGEGEVVYITHDSTGKHYTFKLEPKELEILVKLK